MPEDDEYELLPHEEVEQLRRDVDKLKKNPFGDGKDSRDLIASINDLKHAIQSLHALFAQANHEIEQDFRSTSIKDHFKIISKQNERIAEGIVSVAKMLEGQVQPNTSTTSLQPDATQQSPSTSTSMGLSQEPITNPLPPNQNNFLSQSSPNTVPPLTPNQAQPFTQATTQPESQTSMQPPAGGVPPLQTMPHAGQQPPTIPPPPPPKKKGLFK
ncbi:hypothetical protein K9M74_01385 [Candidatus Woesearchaeota archaeon]|nr:hypothetical protein [Candidatus Woesearchaeota archaeon]